MQIGKEKENPSAVIELSAKWKQRLGLNSHYNAI